MQPLVAVIAKACAYMRVKTFHSNARSHLKIETALESFLHDVARFTLLLMDCSVFPPSGLNHQSVLAATVCV